jgi:branched-chain amino acid transport system ATP-binding protein
MDQPLLETVNICTFYGSTQVLHDVSLEVRKGSVVALLGRNGMGKTTTVHSIFGFLSSKRGEILFRGESIRRLRPYQIVRRGIALVPQGRRVFPSLTVEENLAIADRDLGKGAYSLEKIYSLFPVLKARRLFKASNLSGGEQQMLSFGRALMTDPELLLMDEPSEGLAPLIVQELGESIARLGSRGMSLLLVEQNLQMAFDVARLVYIISKGKIVYSSTIENLKNDENAQSNFLFVEGSVPGHI